MIFQSLTRGTLIMAAGALLSQIINFPNILPLASALLTWAVLLGALAWIAGILPATGPKASGCFDCFWPMAASYAQEGRSL